MTNPDYAGGSIVNLMRSLADACHVPSDNSFYPPLKNLNASDMLTARSIILLVIDGLGWEYLLKRWTQSTLYQHTQAAITSVFPSTTAAAIPAFLTGLAPQQHGLTGWHTYFAELDDVIAPLPLTRRNGGALADSASLPTRLFVSSHLFDQFDRTSFIVSPKDIVDSPFNVHHTGAATRLGFSKLDEMFEIVASLVQQDRGSQFIYAYTPLLDTIGHTHGMDGREAAAAFKFIDQCFDNFLSNIAGKSAFVIATADHGFIDSPNGRLIDLDHYPDLTSMLAYPLCGERRAAFAYVKKKYRDTFLDNANARLGNWVDIVPSNDAFMKGWFGLGTPHPLFAERIGDYVLLPKENWTIKDSVPGEKPHYLIGVHGGMSEAEMRVPLIVVQP